MDVETITPLAVWGGGVASLARIPALGPRPAADSVLWPWPRLEVAQADLTPLMASLVGVRIPVHSVGRLPVSVLRLHPRHQVLTSSKELYPDCPPQVEAVLAQAAQLLAQFSALRARHQQVSLYCTVLCTVLYYELCTG